MENLSNFILENIDTQSLKNYVLGELENTQDEKVLSEIKSIIISHNMDSEKIENYFKNRHLGNCYKLILSIFSRHSNMEELQKLISEGSGISSQDFLNSPNKNIYNIFQKICSEDTIKSLYELNLPNKKNVARGKGEILLNTMLNDINSVGQGDVPTTESGIIEVKVSGGMIKGQKSYDVKQCTETFNKIFSTKFKDVFNGQNALNDILYELKKSSSEEEILKGVTDSYLDKYPVEDNNIKNQLQDYLLSNKGNIFKGSQVDSKIIWDAFLITDFKFYQLLDNWNNLIIFNDNGDYSVITDRQIKQSFENVINILKSNNIKRLTTAVKIHDARFHAIKIKKI